MSAAESKPCASATTRAEPHTEDRFLDGRVLLRQPRQGLRAGLDAVLMAAAVPAKPGDAVLEAGCGSGAALLCLAARVPGLLPRAVEQDEGLMALARVNAAANGLEVAGLHRGDVRDRKLARRLGPVQHAFANPPFWPGGTSPPTALRRAATHEDGAGLADWVGFLHAALAPKGTLTLILPTARMDAAVAALHAAGCGGVQFWPLWPRAGVAAKRVIIQARKGSRSPAAIHPGLVLHDADGGFTAAAQAILRHGQALDQAAGSQQPG